MSLELWRPLKITNPLLEDIFHLNIDTKFKIHPLIIFENTKNKTYYCIRLQTARKSSSKYNLIIDNSSYQTNEYWKNHESVVVTKDIFIIDKELLESNIDKAIYQDTSVLNKNDKSLIVDDLSRRINAIPPDLNIIKISNNLKRNLVLYTNDELINNQLLSTLSNNSNKVKRATKNYFANNFSKSQFLINTNTSNTKYTKEALKDIKLCIDKEKNIINQNDFEYELDKETSNYFIREIAHNDWKDLDKTKDNDNIYSFENIGFLSKSSKSESNYIDPYDNKNIEKAKDKVAKEIPIKESKTDKDKTKLK